jgi:hypothetical protein
MRRDDLPALIWSAFSGCNAAFSVNCASDVLFQAICYLAEPVLAQPAPGFCRSD